MKNILRQPLFLILFPYFGVSYLGPDTRVDECSTCTKTSLSGKTTIQNPWIDRDYLVVVSFPLGDLESCLVTYRKETFETLSIGGQNGPLRLFS